MVRLGNGTLAPVTLLSYDHFGLRLTGSKRLRGHLSPHVTGLLFPTGAVSSFVGIFSALTHYLCLIGKCLNLSSTEGI